MRWHILIGAVAVTTSHCSAEQGALREDKVQRRDINQVAGISNQQRGEIGTVTQGSNSAPAAPGAEAGKDQPHPAQNSARKETSPPKAEPVATGEMPNKTPSLPSVVLASDQALEPAPTLVGPRAGGIGGTYRYQTRPDTTGPQPMLSCKSFLDYAPGEASAYNGSPCSFIGENRAPFGLPPREHSWTFRVTHCPDVALLGTVGDPLCGETDLKNCPLLYPATLISFSEISIDQCYTQKSQLIFTVTNTTTGKTTTQTLDLIKID